MARDLVGKAVGAYRLGEVLGKGQASTVYEAEHSASGRKVAVKVFTPDFSRDKNAAARLVAEVQKATTVRHPHLVEVLDVGMVEHKGKRHLYLVMERLRGESLAARLKERRVLPLEQALRVASDVGAALQAIHRAGARHRTLTAGSVFLCPSAGGEEAVKVLDLGTAQVLAAESPGREEDDIRALALLVQEMLGGPPPPGPGGSRALLPLRLHNRDVPVHVDAALRRALGEGGTPFASVGALVAALLGGGDLLPVCGVWSEGGSLAPPAGRPGMSLGWLAVGALAVLGGGIGLWLYESPRPAVPAPDLLATPDLLAPADLAPVADQAAPGDLAAPDLAEGPDLTTARPPRPRRTGPPIPLLRGPVDFNPELKAVLSPPASAPEEPAAPSKPKRPKRTGPPIPPLRP